MFTGLVRERGRLTANPEPSGAGGVTLRIAHSAELAAGLAVGDSLAVSGVCLTVVEQRSEDGTAVSRLELAPETLARTTLGELAAGAEVNLEPALRLGDPLGGHWLQGHVDAVIEVVARRDLEEHRELDFALPAAYRALVVEKGSVAIDGVSLTVASLRGDRFGVAVIPHTLAETTLATRVPGERVHLEVDILGKYVLRALQTAGRIPAAEAMG